jgi:hypothetical protein
MSRAAALCLLVALAAPVAAQQKYGRPLPEGEAEAPADGTGSEPTSRVQAPDGGPVLEVTFEETEAIPGQPLSLRLTLLVPTFLPHPPVWPSPEAPNLLVRLPERSTNPTSARVGDETWSGVTRNYRISPMVPGDFTIPPQEVIVTYADPDSNEAVKVTLRTEVIAFRGVVPEGAEGLDPFIAADALKLEQRIDGEPGAMVPGDSVTRTVVATVSGMSPMFLPDLLAPVVVAGIAFYPDEPTLAETDERGRPGGSRTEGVTLVAEGGGSGGAPAVTLDWYNLATGEVETASVEGFAIAVDGPPAQTAVEPRDWRAIALMALAGVVAIAAGVWLFHMISPMLGCWISDARGRRLASEAYAYSELRRVIASRDHARLRPALDLWAERVTGPDPREELRVRAALTALGAARYGAAAPTDTDDAWRALAEELPDARKSCRSTSSGLRALPRLNPA